RGRALGPRVERAVPRGDRVDHDRAYDRSDGGETAERPIAPFSSRAVHERTVRARRVREGTAAVRRSICTAGFLPTWIDDSRVRRSVIDPMPSMGAECAGVSPVRGARGLAGAASLNPRHGP